MPVNKTVYTKPLEVISYFTTSLYHKTSVEEIYWDIAKNCIDKLDLEDAVIYEYDSERNILVQKAAFGTKNPNGRYIFNCIEIPLGSGIVGEVAKIGKPILVSDTSKDERYIVDDVPRCSEIAVPILLDGKVYGVIDSEHSKKGFFTEDHLHIFTILANLCSQQIKALNKKKRKKLTADNEHFKKLLQLMDSDKLFQRSELGLGKLSDKLGISPTYLSYLVNDVTGKGLADFINGYRVEAIKEKLADERYERFTLLSIGLEAGFSSKSTFNNIFKKMTGFSPSQYKNSLKEKNNGNL